jgi:hypothetical protein
MLSWRYPAKRTDNFIAAARPAISANTEKTATIRPLRRPLKMAITRIMRKMISMVMVIQFPE